MNKEYRFLDVSKYKSEECRLEAYNCLSVWRREKVDAQKTGQGRLLSLGAGILFDEAMRSRGLDPDKTRIAVNRYGKPFLPDHPDLHFSLSHSGAFELCAVSNREVGCDIQIIEERRLSAVSRAFSEEEARILSELDKSEERAFFYRVWTLKESLIKADGRGLAFPMQSISVMQSAGQCRDVVRVQEKEYRLTELPAPEGYCAAVCELL